MGWLLIVAFVYGILTSKSVSNGRGISHYRDHDYIGMTGYWYYMQSKTSEDNNDSEYSN